MSGANIYEILALATERFRPLNIKNHSIICTTCPTI